MNFKLELWWTSLTTITRTLSKYRVRMKQLYTVPFERNSERVKELRRQCPGIVYIQFNVQFYKLCTLQVGNLHSNRLQYSMVYINDMIYVNFVSESYGIGGQPGPSWIHIHRQGRIQSGQKASTWTKCNWKKGHSWCARTERGKHYHVCSNCKCRHTSFTDVRLDPIIPSASLPFSMISTSAWFQSRIRRVKTWGPL